MWELPECLSLWGFYRQQSTPYIWNKTPSWNPTGFPTFLGIYCLCDVKDVGSKSIHPSIHFRPLIRGRVAGAAAWAGTPRLPSPRTLPPALPKVFPGQLSDIVTPACPRSSSGSPPSGTCQEHLPREASCLSYLVCELQGPFYSTPINLISISIMVWAVCQI